MSLCYTNSQMTKKLGMDSILSEEKNQWWESTGCITVFDQSICGLATPIEGDSINL